MEKMDKPSAKIKQDAIDAMAYAFEQMNSPKPLLVIELQDESSVPKVFYKGKEIELKKHIRFEWDTKDAVSLGGLTYAIEHYENEDMRQPVLNGIERRLGDHAL